jgi:Zn finger protein HypA/HybF involved in hydrogenase expression
MEQKNAAYVDALEHCFERCMALFERDDWQPLASPHADIQLFAVASATGRTLKVRGEVEGATAEKLFREVFNQDLAEKKRLGQDFLVADHVIVEIGEMTVLRRQQFKLVWPISDRETITARGGRKWQDKWVQFECSVEHPKYPVQSSPVRAKVNNACFVYEQLEGDRVRATYLADVDMGGSIPAWLVAMGDAKACDRIVSFRRIAKEKNLK